MKIADTSFKNEKFTRCLPSATGETQINFYFQLNSEEPCCTQKYTTKNRCRHVDHDFNFPLQLRITYTYCMEKHMNVDEIQDWLRCPMHMQWFH